MFFMYIYIYNRSVFCRTLIKIFNNLERGLAATMNLSRFFCFKMKSGIYKITFDGSDNIYIGQAGDIYQRKLRHLSLLKLCKHYNKKLQRSFIKYGNIQFSIIELCSIDLLNEREQHHIDSNLGKNLCNTCMIAGSCRGIKRSEKTKAKLSKAKSGKPSAIKGMKKRPDQVELNKKIAKTLTERNKNFGLLNLKTRKKVNQYDMDGNFVRSYDSIRHAEKFGFGRKEVSKCLRGLLIKTKGFRFERGSDGTL